MPIYFHGGFPIRWRFTHIVCAAVAALLFFPLSLRPQTAENLAIVKRVALEWSGSEHGSSAIRDRLVQKLKASKKLEFVANPGGADGILHGDVRVWVSSYVSTTPKSNAVQQPVYRGYASVEVTGKGGRTLWSYLATPRSPGWKNITEDLSDQLAQALLSALAKKDAADENPSAHGANTDSAHSANSIDLQGAGATFPAPMYQKWFEGFTHSRPDVKITFAAVGSEEGIRRFSSGQVDFGASDMPLPAEQWNAPGKKILQLATLLGGVVPIYNVTGAPDGLNFTGEVLAGIFLGKIQRWNAPEIRAINKRAHLPDEAIVVIHRSDGSGTTFVWTEYLSKVSTEWKSSVGVGPEVKWPTGNGAEHNDGVAMMVRKTRNSIGYVELLYALQNELEFAAVRNASGEFVKADLDSITAAAKSAVLTEEQGFAVSITNAKGKHAYPISTFSWLLLPENSNSPDAAKQAALRELLRWMLTSGQKQCEGLGYAPLPTEIVNRELNVLAGSR
jgi:phosphate ABC transporter phosphate-binding protein